MIPDPQYSTAFGWFSLRDRSTLPECSSSPVLLGVTSRGTGGITQALHNSLSLEEFYTEYLEIFNTSSQSKTAFFTNYNVKA